MSPETFTCSRMFNAPRALVWKAWSEPQQLAQWWGPKGCKAKIMGMELRPGGFTHYSMVFSTGATMWGRFMYREIAAPSHLVWLNSFSDEHGGITRAPFEGLIPLEIENVVTLAEEGGRTALTLRATPFGATPEERAFFGGFHDSLKGGYGGTMDQLAEHLAGK